MSALLGSKDGRCADDANDKWRSPDRGTANCARLGCCSPTVKRRGGAGGSGRDGHQVDRRVLASSVDLEVELQPVALVELAQPRALDGADVDERVGLAVVAGDEAEALHRVEELDRAS